MRVDDCEMLDMAREPGAVNYRVRHKRTGGIVTIHILNSLEAEAPEALSLLQSLPLEERPRVLDHGQDGPLIYFVTQGLPDGEGFISWLNRFSGAGSRNGPANEITPDQMQQLREIFEQASALPPQEQGSYVSRRCGNNRHFEARVLRMLGVGINGDRFLEIPAAQQVAAETGNIPVTLADTTEAEPLESEFAPGTLIGERYLVDREVGRGGFGIIYLAHDQQVNNRHVVLKVRRGGADPLNPEMIRRFRREVASLACIVHPSVVGVLDVGETEKGTPYFVMQYVPGLTLRQKLKTEGPMPLPRVAAIVRQISHALSVAHEKGICHRDLKPDNVMLQDLGDGEELAIIIDFGIATMKENNTAKTAFTRAIGTMAYMPPEQREGHPTAASDTYALGVMTFEMIAGRRPDRSIELRRQKLSALRRGVPKAVESVIAKAMSDDPSARQKRTRDFGDALAAAIQPSRTAHRDILLRAALVVITGICIGLVGQRWIPRRTPPGAIHYHVSRSGPRILLSLTAPHAGHLYILNEKQLRKNPVSPNQNARFEILFPDLSYFGSPLRYLTDRSVDFILPSTPRREGRVLWVLWSEEPVEAVETLGRAQRASLGVAAAQGLDAPQIGLWVKEYRKTGGDKLSTGPLMQLVLLSGNKEK